MRNDGIMSDSWLAAEKFEEIDKRMTFQLIYDP